MNIAANLLQPRQMLLSFGRFFVYQIRLADVLVCALVIGIEFQRNTVVLKGLGKVGR